MSEVSGNSPKFTGKIVPPKGACSGTSTIDGTAAPASVIQRLFAVPFGKMPTTSDVKDRLDTVVGIAGWRMTYQIISADNIQCKLSVKIQGEWVSREGFGNTPFGAFGMAALEFGIGRFD